MRTQITKHSPAYPKAFSSANKEQMLETFYHTTSEKSGQEKNAASLTADSVNFHNGPAHNFGQVAVFPKTPVMLQPKLTINEPGDIYEQEADRLAEQVMQMPAPALQRKCACGGTCSKCQEHHNRETHLQTKRLVANNVEQTGGPAIVHPLLHSPSELLDPETRDFMETRLGYDFSKVRIHTNAYAAESAQALNARAYTFGNHVIFGRSQYQPKTYDGQRLLAHELTHIVQQHHDGNLRIQRSLAGCQDLIADPSVASLISGTLVHRIIAAHFNVTVAGARSVVIPGASAGRFGQKVYVARQVRSSILK